METVNTASEALTEAQRRLWQALERGAPPPKLKVSDWADQFRVLSPISSAEHGPWRTDRAPYQREMMDAILEPHVENVVYAMASQMGKTDVMLNILGYFMDRDPCPILWVLPTTDLAQAWSKDRLAPMIAESPRLRGRVRTAKSRDSENTILHKRFSGGQLSIVGANSPSALASRPIRIVGADEIDRFPPSAGSEGDPLALARRRADTFWNHKFIDTSTPTVKGRSRIEEAWNESDQRRFYVPCPLCGEMQILKWNPSDGQGGVVWASDADGHPNLDSVLYECAECREKFDLEIEKYRMLAEGRWVPTFPERRVAGFHINQLYSPWRTLKSIVEEWHTVRKNPERLKVFVNTVLGETWEEAGEGVGAETLKARLEHYDAEVPRGSGCLVASVDVQTDRLEVKVKGYGREFESWLIEHTTIDGDPGGQPVWDRLDTYLRGRWTHESGQQIGLDCAVIDSGGQHTEQVYKFTHARARGIRIRTDDGERRVLCFAIKGAAGAREIVGRPTFSERYKVKLYVVGVDTAKDVVFSRMRVRVAGPGFMHLPGGSACNLECKHHRVDTEYLEQLTGERAVRRWRKGKGWQREWEKTRERNEALDLEVYALAALHILGAAMIKAMPERADAWAKRIGGGEDASANQAGGARATAKRRRRGGGWVSGWKR